MDKVDSAPKLDEEAQKREKRLITLAVIAGSVVLVVVSYVLAVKGLRNRARAKRAELRAKYVKPFAPKVSEENPAKYFKEAMNKVNALFGIDLLKFDTQWDHYNYSFNLSELPKGNLPKKSSELIVLLSTKERDVFELIKKAKSLHGRADKIQNRDTSNLIDTKQVHNFLRLAILAQIKKNPDLAMEYLTTLLDNKIYSISSGMLIEYMIFVAIQINNHSFAASVLNEWQNTSEQRLLKIRKLLSPRIDTDQLKYIYTEDVAQLFDLYETEYGQSMPNIKLNYFHYKTELDIYDHLQRDYKFWDDEYFDRLNTTWTSSLEVFVEDENASILPISPAKNMTTPYYLLRFHREYLARSRTLVLAVDVLLARKKLGRLPKDLAEIETTLGITVPNDPFSATDKIKYEITSDGFKTGSVSTEQHMSFEIKLRNTDTKKTD